MYSKIRYESIKNKVMHDFDKYIKGDLTVNGATVRILMDDCMIANYNAFTKASYFLIIAIESVKQGEMNDYIYEKTGQCILERFEDITEEEEKLYKQDLDVLKNLYKNYSFKLIATSDISKDMLNHYLSLKSDLRYLKLKINAGNMVKQDVLRKYSRILPEELIEIWEMYGFGSLMEGYLRMIEPEEYQELLYETYFRGKISIPIMTTAFGDIITFEEGGYVGIVKYRYGTFLTVSRHFRRFMSNLEEKYFVNKYLQIPQYMDTAGKLGTLEQDECFGCLSPLEHSDSEKDDDFRKIKTREYIQLISCLSGKIGM